MVAAKVRLCGGEVGGQRGDAGGGGEGVKGEEETLGWGEIRGEVVVC